jgi:serine/threonine-protein kinase
MGEVFLSYRAEDRARIRPLVSALEVEGFSVWWDAQIEGGTAWRHTIQRELEGAGVVIVAWSENSVGPEGRFVQDEASLAQSRGTYLPILIDRVRPPLGFGETQSLRLIGWEGDAADPRFQALAAAVRAKLAGGPMPQLVADTVAKSAPKRLMDRRGLIAGGAAAAAAVAGAGGWALWDRMRPGSDDKSIAVLPFANLSGDPAQAYFADGIAEELRSALARLGELKVIGRASCEAVRDAALTEAAKKLGVGHILTGSVRRSPSLIRVNAQLIDGRDGSERWSETYDRAPGDTLEIQTGIAENVASALRVQLGEAQKAALTVGGTRNAAAHDLVLKAVAQLRADDSQPTLLKGLSILDEALTLDPGYAEAHARRSITLSNLWGLYGATQHEQLILEGQAVAAARKAIALAPRLAIGHTAMGIVTRAQLDMGSAFAEYERAYALAGDDPQVLRSYASPMSQVGRADEALALMARAIALDPLDITVSAAQARILLSARRFAAAEASAREVLAKSPKRSTVRYTLAESLLLQGKLDEAEAEYARLPAGFFLAAVGQALVAARRGDRPRGEAAVSKLKHEQGDSASYQFGQILAQLGDLDSAFAALDRGWVVRDPGLQFMRVDPLLDPLRKDPRFQALEKKLNFPA